MIKNYPLIAQNGFLYVVEANTIFHLGNYYIDDADIVREVTIDDNEYWKARPDYSKIIASNNPALSTLPSLPEMDEDLDALFLEAGGKYCEEHELEYRVARRFFITGYEAAFKQRMYSEEDMKKAFISGRKFQQGGKSAKEQPGRNEPDFDTFLKSLTKQPIAIEVEMKDEGGWAGDFDEKQWWMERLVPKVDSNNKIIGRYIYA